MLPSEERTRSRSATHCHPVLKDVPDVYVFLKWDLELAKHKNALLKASSSQEDVTPTTDSVATE